MMAAENNLNRESENYTEQDIDQEYLHIVIKLVEQREREKRPTQIEGLRDIHPIHEALVALIVQNLSHPEIVEAFRREPESLRKIIATDTLLDYFAQPARTNQRANLVSLLRQGKTMEELVNMAALEIAGDKRAQDGRVLIPAYLGEQAYGKDFLRALKYTNSSSIYVDQSEIDSVRQNASRIKARRNRKIIGTLVLAGLAAGSYYFFKDRFESAYNAFISPQKAMIEKTNQK